MQHKLLTLSLTSLGASDPHATRVKQTVVSFYLAPKFRLTPLNSYEVRAEIE